MVTRLRKKPAAGYRSGLEDSVSKALTEAGQAFEYETLSIPYQKKVSKYTPDIILANGIIIEVKGYFDAEDRAKHQLIKEQHPELDIRFVFQSSKKKIHKSSDTTYGSWAAQHGYLFADKEVPAKWYTEITSEIYKKAVAAYRKKIRKRLDPS